MTDEQKPLDILMEQTKREGALQFARTVPLSWIIEAYYQPSNDRIKIIRKTLIELATNMSLTPLPPQPKFHVGEWVRVKYKDAAFQVEAWYRDQDQYKYHCRDRSYYGVSESDLIALTEDDLRQWWGER